MAMDDIDGGICGGERFFSPAFFEKQNIHLVKLARDRKHGSENPKM